MFVPFYLTSGENLSAAFGGGKSSYTAAYNKHEEPKPTPRPMRLYKRWQVNKYYPFWFDRFGVK